MRILLVDGEPAVRHDLRSIIEEAGHSVVGEAGTAEEALRCAAEHTPDVVLIEIHLPGDRTGIEAARAIREQLAIRCLFVSGPPGQLRESADAALPLGFLLKPVTADRLVPALDEIARRLENEG